MHCSKEAVEAASLLERIEKQQRARRKQMLRRDMCLKCEYRRKYR